MATYPSGIASFSTKVDGTSTVVAADPNNIQAEVVAIETIIGTNPNQSALASPPAYVASPNSSSFSTMNARIANIESGLVTALSGSYTQISQQVITSSSGAASASFTSIPATYQKLVIYADFTSVTTGGLLIVTVNGITTSTYTYNRISYAASPIVSGSSNDTSFLMGTVSTTNNICTIEIPNYARSTTGKVITALFGNVSINGFQTTATAVNRVDVSIVGSTTATATVTLFGVK